MRQSAEFFTKDIEYAGVTRSILIQNDNGPCALLALANYLLLQGSIKVNTDSVVFVDDLVNLILNYILETNPGETANKDRIRGILHGMTFGMDVNVGFGGPELFENTPEVELFRMLHVPLFHAWVVSVDDYESYPYIFDKYYDTAVAKLATDIYDEAEVEPIRRWLDRTSSQLTADGLEQATARLADGRKAVMFINNHLSTVVKHRGVLYSLVTDAGFADSSQIIWESLDQLDGDTRFVSSRFEGPLPTSPINAPLIPRRVAKPKKSSYCFIC